jgi:hypothetical protein
MTGAAAPTLDFRPFHQRFIDVADNLESIRLADDRQLYLGLTHYGIDAGETLWAAIDHSFLVLEPKHAKYYEEIRADHGREQRVPSHLRFHHDERWAMIADPRIMYLGVFAAERYGITEPTYINTAGTDAPQRRMMFAERARALAGACRRIGQEVHQNESRLPLWLRNPLFPYGLSRGARTTLLTTPLPAPAGELLALSHFGQAAMSSVFESRLPRSWTEPRLQTDVLVQNTLFALKSGRDSILMQLPADRAALVGQRCDRLIGDAKAALDLYAQTPLDQMWLAPVEPSGYGKMRGGPWIAAAKAVSDAAEDVLRLVPFVVPPEAESTPAAVSDKLYYSARYYRDEYGIPPARLRKAAERGQLKTKGKRSGKRYQFIGVKHLWEEDVTHDPGKRDEA